MEERHTGGRAYALRLAGWEDVDLLFSWANEREVRRYGLRKKFRIRIPRFIYSVRKSRKKECCAWIFVETRWKSAIA